MRDEASIWNEQRLYRITFEQAPHPTVVVDHDGAVLLANRAAAELRAVDLAAFLAWEDGRPADPRARELWSELRASGHAEVELRVMRPGGAPRFFAIEARSIGARRHVVIAREVTASRILEQELVQMKRLDSVGYLTASVVHDFNNLLTPILCASALLSSEIGEDARASSLVAEIRGAAERAVGLVRQVLALVRREPARLDRVHVGAMLDEMRALLDRVMGSEVRVDVSWEPGLGDVRVDREQLEQVVLNLAANARDAMPHGGTLSLKAANVELDPHDADAHDCPKSGAYVVLTVTDTGIGMAPETRERVFESFFTTKEHGLGTGLGLASAYRVVKRSGGCIAVRSEAGRGTSVVIYLPRAGASEAPSSRPREPELPRGDETVLVVDDDDAVRDVVRLVLEEQGYRVIAAPSGKDAIGRAAAYDGEIHLVIADVVMPGMNGCALAEALRAAGRSFRVLFMSGHADAAVKKHGLDDDGRVPLLRKAFSPTELARKVREVLDG